MIEFLSQIKQLLGSQYVIDDINAMQSYLIDQRRRYQGLALAVVLPSNTIELASVVKLCNQFQIPMVTQGGNTGLVLGSIPDKNGRAIIISTRRLVGLITIDTFNHTMTVAAGSTLAEVQQWAAEHDCFFPLSLASEGSCTIGGNLATNAGGTAVLRYGNARELCLGLEVVLANGEVWSGLRGLRKDNTGYDLRDLFVGSEGTLGIITQAVLKLYPRPRTTHTAWIGLSTLDEVLTLFSVARQNLSNYLTGFELMSEACLQLVERHYPHYPKIGSQQPSKNYAVLLEISDPSSADLAYPVLLDMLEQVGQLVNTDALWLAHNQAQSEQFWAIREVISAAQAKEGPNIKHDISLPISAIPEFHKETELMLQNSYGDVRVICFGHIGDGNLHYNISAPLGQQSSSFLEQQAEINRLVHNQVAKYKGSISAEHGIGMLKRDELLRYKSELEIALMRKIKNAFDPQNLLNPGKILHDSSSETAK